MVPGDASRCWASQQWQPGLRRSGCGDEVNHG